MEIGLYGHPTLSLTQMPVVTYQDQPLTSGPALKFQDQPERDQDQPEWVTGIICVGVTHEDKTRKSNPLAKLLPIMTKGSRIVWRPEDHVNKHDLPNELGLKVGS